MIFFFANLKFKSYKLRKQYLKSTSYFPQTLSNYTKHDQIMVFVSFLAQLPGKSSSRPLHMEFNIEIDTERVTQRCDVFFDTSARFRANSWLSQWLRNIRSSCWLMNLPLSGLQTVETKRIQIQSKRVQMCWWRMQINRPRNAKSSEICQSVARRTGCRWNRKGPKDDQPEATNPHSNLILNWISTCKSF